MSRGGGRGGRGGARRGGFGGQSNPLPMGLTFLDIQNMSREGTALYPPRQLPTYTQPSDEEKQVAQLQIAIATRLKSSPYYVVERTKSTELRRYSDKYRPSAASRSTLQRSKLHAPFFPTEIFEDYFNAKRKKKVSKKMIKSRVNLDEVGQEDEQEKSGDERQSEVGSEAPQSDYDVEEEYDNDYAENYFDNGEGDDLDNLGDGGDDGGGAGYDWE
ncbi:DNA-directed RNA polymerase III, subunit Rpc31 [Amanita rubescens]|nr:DNA-directed RNA polymerase III, subunit Rpc31 [Amanita rubescens]